MGYKSKFKGAEIDARLEKMVNVTYAELVALRDEGKLIAGQMYRMTDYETTCTWENTQVAGHPFDLVLTALDNKTLDEKCSAIWSERDTDGYFANSNLPAWDVRYCLDNDKARFEWAQMGGKFLIAYDEWDEYEAVQDGTIEIDGVTYIKWTATNGWAILCTETATPQYEEEIIVVEIGYEEDPWAAFVSGIEERIDGKGIIYRLIDESENSVPYDFKNIMFMRPLTEGELDGENGIETFCYTFSCIQESFAIEDQSVKEPDYCYNNKFASCCADNVFLVWYGDECYSNTFGDNCYSNTFGNECYSNTFGNGCYSNTFGNGCYSNTFGDNCYYNTFGNSYNNNTFGNGCDSNTFGNGCHSNIFEYECYSNTFGDNCYSNTFGNECYSNTFGNNCYSNTFGNSCHNNTFGVYFSFNTFGDRFEKNTFGDNCDGNILGYYCKYNTFGNFCYSNTFGNNCDSNTFGDNCYYNTFGNSCEDNTFGNFCYYNTFGNDCDSNTYGGACFSNIFGDMCTRISFEIEGLTSSYVKGVIIGSLCSNIILKNHENATSTNIIKNYVINVVEPDSSSKLEIEVERNRNYQTFIAKKKDGTIVEYTVDDIINNMA